jgi:hypothetical protein
MGFQGGGETRRLIKPKGISMKIELLVSRSGVGGAQNRGTIIDVSSAEGQRMIDVGQAKLLRAAKPDKAVKFKSQTAEKAAKG